MFSAQVKTKERFCEETWGRGGLCQVLVKVMFGFFVRFTGFFIYFLFIWFIMKEDGNFGEMGMRMPERKSSAGHVILQGFPTQSFGLTIDNAENGKWSLGQQWVASLPHLEKMTKMMSRACASLWEYTRRRGMWHSMRMSCEAIEIVTWLQWNPKI